MQQLQNQQNQLQGNMQQLQNQQNQLKGNLQQLQNQLQGNMQQYRINYRDKLINWAKKLQILLEI